MPDPNRTTPPRCMSVAEAAEYLGRPAAFVRLLCHSGTVPPLVVGRRLYLSRVTLDAWLTGGAAEPDPGSVRVEAPYIMPML